MSIELDYRPFYEGTKTSPSREFSIEDIELEAAFYNVRDIEGARQLMQKVLYQVKHNQASTVSQELQDIARDKLKRLIHDNSPLNPPTLKEGHPSRRRFEAGTLLTLALEEASGTKDEEIAESLQTLDPDDYRFTYAARVIKLRDE
jgi:hypothetical protein